MDQNKIADLLRATIDPNQRAQAEKQLESAHKIIGFYPTLLQVIMNNQIEGPVRQSAAIYLKNGIHQHWEDHENVPGTPLIFNIHEQCRAQIRDSILDAIVLAPDTLRPHLGQCINQIVRSDFPGKFGGIVDKIAIVFQSADEHQWLGGCMALYQLSKHFEYKDEKDRDPMNRAMKVLLPYLHQKYVSLFQVDNDGALIIQKQILKVFFAFIQYNFPDKVMTRDVFLPWMEVLQQTVARAIPPRVEVIEKDERDQAPAWKLKKWALHILTRMFDRYGSPSSVDKKMKEFADWYIKTFSSVIINSLLALLEQYANGIYVSPRVLQQTLNYMSTAVNNAFSWKLVKLHMNLIVQNILFPILCFSNDDQETWENDPIDYIRIKFDILEDFVSPVTAAQSLLHTVCKKRKGMLERTLEFVVTILSNPASEPKQRDGALHMVGSVADILQKKDCYKNQMETMLTLHVIPNLESPTGYLRARACYVLNFFADTRFVHESELGRACSLVHHCILHDDQLPVQVQAAICFQGLITNQPFAQKAAEPTIRAIALKLLEIMRETENEDITNVVQKLLYHYTEQLVPVALEMTNHMAATFDAMSDNLDDDGEDRSMTAMAILNTIDTLLTLVDNEREMMVNIEPIVVKIIRKIFTKEIVDLYEDALTIACTLNGTAVSSHMWELFQDIYALFNRDGFDYWTDMMPTLHNFVTVDPAAFMSNPNYRFAVFEMCKKVLDSPESSEDAECHAGKMLECLMIQYKGQIDDFIRPIVELVLTRMTRETKTQELKNMCLQVIVVAMWYNPQLLIQSMLELTPADSTQPIFDHFVKQWIKDAKKFQGLHDRKVSVLGIVTLLSLPCNVRPAVVGEMTTSLLPTCLQLFQGLHQAYKLRAAQENEDDDDYNEYEDSDPESDPEDLDDDEDHIPATMDDVESADGSQNGYSDYGEDDDDEPTILESYTTPLDEELTLVDEYVLFKGALEKLQVEEKNWYDALVASIDVNQQKALQEVFVMADQRNAAIQSKLIEKQGGYLFATDNVPVTFNFGGALPGFSN